MDVEEGVFECALLEPCFVGGGMTRIAVFRSLAVAVGAVSMLAAGGGGNNNTTANTASDPTPSVSTGGATGNLDPGPMSAAVGIHNFPHTYSGPFKVGDPVNEVPPH